MPRTALNRSWKNHPTNEELYCHIPPISKSPQQQRMRFPVHWWRSKKELAGDVLLCSQHKLANWWMTQDADLMNYQLQWITEKCGRSVSWNTESARPDDDDNDDDESSSAFWGRRFSSVITDGRFVSVKESRDTWCRKYTDDYEVIFVFSNIAEKARDLCHKLFLWKSILLLYSLETFASAKAT